MNPAYKAKALLLRRTFPVGLQQALTLLQQTDGDLAATEQLLKQAAVAAVVAQTGATPEQAQQHLHEQHYDVARAASRLEQELFPLTERLLRRYQQYPWEAVTQIAAAVQRQLDLPRILTGHGYPMLQLNALPPLPAAVRCLLTVTEWLHYVDAEVLREAVCYYPELVAAALRDELHLPAAAQILPRTQAIVREADAAAEERSRRRPGRTGPVWLARHSRAYAAQQEALTELQPLIVHRLLHLIRASLDVFPR